VIFQENVPDTLVAASKFQDAFAAREPKRSSSDVAGEQSRIARRQLVVD